MKKIKNVWVNDMLLRILVFTSIGLLIGAFFVPPMAVIDASILAAVGEIAGIMAINELDKGLNKGLDASIKHNNTEISVKNDETEKNAIS